MDQVKQAQDKAVRFAQHVLADDRLADELEGLSPEEYADRKRLVIRNPHKLQKGPLMPRRNNLTDRVADLEDKLDLIAGIISGDVDEDDSDDSDDDLDSDDSDDDDL